MLGIKAHAHYYFIHNLLALTKKETSFRRRFGAVLDIIPLADSVTKLTARCELCGQRAFFTLRKTQETQTELIGGADVYMPVCRQHYINGQIVMETTRIVLDVERSTMIQTLK